MAIDSPRDAEADRPTSAEDLARPTPETSGETAPDRVAIPVPVRLKTMARRLADSLTTSDDAVLAAEPVSPHHVVTAPVPTSAGPRTPIVLGASLIAGLVGAVLIVATSPVWHLAPAAEWRFTFPGLRPGELGGSSLYFGATFLAGVLALTAGWLGVMDGVGRMNANPAKAGRFTGGRIVIIATVVWSLPFLIGPIQISTDAYSYSAQGYMASLGIDPSAQGPNALPNHSSNPFWRASDPIWRNSPAPYGPVAVFTAEAAVTLSGSDVFTSMYLFRALAVAGVIMTGVGVYIIASKRRVNPALALALAVANPVVLIHLIGGAHNDAVMMGFLCLGLAAWERSRKWLAVALVALAVMVKLPAVLALAFIAWNWKGRDADWKQRLVDFPIVGAAVAAMVGALCLLVGIGFGWVTALTSTGSVYSTFSPSTKLGFILSDLINGVGIDVNPLTVVGVTRAMGLFTAGVIMTLVLLRSHRIGVTMSTGIAMLSLMLLGPVIWPWYLPVGFALLAAAGIRRYRPTIIVLIVASSLIVWPSSVDAVVPLSRYQHWLGLMVVGIIAGSCVAAQYVARFAERRRAHGKPLPGVEAVLLGPPPVAVAAIEPEPAAADPAPVAVS